LPVSKKERESNRAARAAAIQQAQVTKERNRKILITVAVMVLLAGVVVAGVLLSGSNSSTPDSKGAPEVSVDGAALVLGEGDSDVTKVVIYEDFLCPYCREFETASRDLLHTSAARGDVVVEYRPFQLLPDHYSARSLTAWGAVLQDGTPEQALSFHDLLFDNQPYESAQDKPGVTELTSLAKEAGVDDPEVLDSLGKEDPAFVAEAGQDARDAGVQSTPTVLVDGEELQGESITQMVRTLEDMLGQ
jgi:protein-disulfide isomerase